MYAGMRCHGYKSLNEFWAVVSSFHTRHSTIECGEMKGRRLRFWTLVGIRTVDELSGTISNRYTHTSTVDIRVCRLASAFVTARCVLWGGNELVIHLFHNSRLHCRPLHSRTDWSSIRPCLKKNQCISQQLLTFSDSKLFFFSFYVLDHSNISNTPF